MGEPMQNQELRLNLFHRVIYNLHRIPDTHKSKQDVNIVTKLVPYNDIN